MTASLAVGGVSMMHGWLPATVQLIAVAAVAGSLVGRSRRWFIAWSAPLLMLGAFAAWAAHAYMDHLGIAGEPAPWQLWWWIAGCALCALIVVAGWPVSRWFRRNLTVFAAALCLLSTGLTINTWIGYFPTVSVAWNQLTDQPLPGQTDRETVSAMQRDGPVPATGATVAVDIPSAASGFTHRDEFVYLPPAWFATNPPPRLPTIMMIGGEFHTPADWARAGAAVTTLDDFAASHAGYAPIAVFVDSGGAFTVDTECVNGPRGNAAAHLTKDVVPYVNAQFGTDGQQSRWGVAGFSSGGTCALDLTVMHPDMFHAFADIAGDPSPNAGDKQQTIERLFGGDPEAWSSFDPASVITAHGTYRDAAGMIVNPDDSESPAGQGNEALCALGRSHGLSCDVVTLDGRHDWPFAARAFEATLPWLAGQLRLSDASEVPLRQSTAPAENR